MILDVTELAALALVVAAVSFVLGIAAARAFYRPRHGPPLPYDDNAGVPVGTE